VTYLTDTGQTTFFSYTGQAITRETGYLTLEDVAVGLGRVCRYAGGSREFWPVLLHSFVVADLLPAELKAHGLLHDMTDVLFGDIPKPFKLPETYALQRYLHDRLLPGLGLGLASLASYDQALVKAADVRAFVGEKVVLAPPGLDLGIRDPKAEWLTEDYLRAYAVSELLRADGQAVVDFTRRVQAAAKQRST
jgi:hypothetical protein